MPSLSVKLRFVNKRAQAWITIPHHRRLVIYVSLIAFSLAGWGAYLTFWRPSAEIIVDGKKIVTHKIPANVEELLKDKQITLGPKDIVIPPLSEPVPRREAVIVIRVTEKSVQIEDEPIFCILWQKLYTNNLRPAALQKGVMKRNIQQVRILYHDGAEKERQTLRQWQTKKTLYRLCLLDDKNRYEKIYELPACKKMKMVATAYYPGDPLAWRDGTITYLGQKMQRGIIAVDPKVIPLKTRLYVPGYGYGYAGDTGSAIKGRRIDLGVNNKQEEKSWMHKRVVVYILEKSDTW